MQQPRAAPEDDAGTAAPASQQEDAAAPEPRDDSAAPEPADDAAVSGDEHAATPEPPEAASEPIDDDASRYAIIYTHDAWRVRRRRRPFWRWVFRCVGDCPRAAEGPVVAVATTAEAWREKRAVDAAPAAAREGRPQASGLASLPAPLVALVVLAAAERQPQDFLGAEALSVTCRWLHGTLDEDCWRHVVERDHGGAEGAAALAVLLSLPPPRGDDGGAAPAFLRDGAAPVAPAPAAAADASACDPSTRSSTSWSMPGGVLARGDAVEGERRPPIRLVATEDGVAAVVGVAVRAGALIGDLAGELSAREPFRPDPGAPNAAADEHAARGGILGGGIASLLRDPTLRRFFGDRAEVYQTASTAGRRTRSEIRSGCSGVTKGNALLRNVRHANDPGAPTAATAAPEIRMTAERHPLVALRATRRLEPLEEVVWNNLQVMSGPVVQQAARDEPDSVRETHTRPQTNELGRLLGAIVEVNKRVVRRQGTHVLYAY